MKTRTRSRKRTRRQKGRGWLKDRLYGIPTKKQILAKDKATGDAKPKYWPYRLTPLKPEEHKEKLAQEEAELAQRNDASDDYINR